jgi:hypothetical protein
MELILRWLDTFHFAYFHLFELFVFQEPPRWSPGALGKDSEDSSHSTQILHNLRLSALTHRHLHGNICGENFRTRKALEVDYPENQQ